MAKMIKIRECFQCPHCWRVPNDNVTVEIYCGIKDKIIKDGYIIQKWCPLPDYPEEGKDG